jgi:hypothetical protein
MEDTHIKLNTYKSANVSPSQQKERKKKKERKNMGSCVVV